MGRHVRHIATALFLLVTPTALNAEALHLGQQPYNYTVLDEDLRDVLRQFGANTGLRVAVSDVVQGRVRGRREAVPPKEFLDQLAKEFGFDWYYDGYTLYLTAIGESVTKMIPLGGTSFASLTSSLKALGIADDRFTLRPVPQADTAMVAGPPRYVELVEQTARTLAKPPAAPPAETVTVYRGSTR